MASRQRASASARSRLIFEQGEAEPEERLEVAAPASLAPPSVASPSAAAPQPAASERYATSGRSRIARLQSEPIALHDLRKTTQKFHRSHLNYLDAFVDSLWVDDESRLSRDFIVRVLLRAVLELGLELDFEQITLTDEVEMVRRVQDALSEHFAS